MDFIIIKPMSNGSSNNPFFLFPDEEIIFKTNPHWIFLLVHGVPIFLLWLFYELYACPTCYFYSIKGLCFLLSGVVFPLVILIIYLDWRFDRFYLTNFRMVKERGIIGQRFMSIFHEQVEDVTAGYGFWGKIFGFGYLNIESAGTLGNMTFKGIPDPIKTMFLIEQEFFIKKTYGD